ncbi:hypothetical protein ACWC0A_31720 [Streptomyces scopuliridis]
MVLLLCAFAAYLAYEHPGLEAPLVIALAALTAVATVFGVVALLRR